MLGLCPGVVKALSSVGALSPLLEKLAEHHIQSVRKNRLIKGIWGADSLFFTFACTLCIFAKVLGNC